MKQVRVRYSPEFKMKAVELVQAKGNLSEVARELNLNTETLRLWVRASKKGELKAEPGNQETRKSKEELEIVRLKKELYEIKLERDILKKAVGIFSKSDR